MMNLNSTSNVALLSNHGTSAYETGTQSYSSNALRSYNPDGKRRRKPSTTSAMRTDMVVMLMNAFPGIRRVKIHDSGIEFQARVRLQGGGIVYRTAGVKENKSAWEDFNRWSTDLETLPNGEWRGKRKDKEKVWVIEIDDIMEFVKKLDEQIILTAPGKFVEDYPCIEIYDDYRE